MNAEQFESLLNRHVLPMFPGSRIEAAVEAVKSSSAALARALELAGDQAIVLSAGSVAFAGEVKTAWQKLNL